MSETSNPVPVNIRYRDRNGEIAWKRIMPGRTWCKETEGGRKEWVLHARDLGDQVDRDFSQANILEWKNGT